MEGTVLIWQNFYVIFSQFYFLIAFPNEMQKKNEQNEIIEQIDERIEKEKKKHTHRQIARFSLT